MKKIISLSLVTIISIIYYNFWYKIGSYLPKRFEQNYLCIPYDKRCFILALEYTTNISKIALSWKEDIVWKYWKQEDIIFKSLENWNYSIPPTITIFVAKSLNEPRLNNLKEKVLIWNSNSYSNFLIWSLLIDSRNQNHYYLLKNPNITNFKLSSSPVVRAWYAIFISGNQNKDAMIILEQMLQIETDKQVIKNINYSIYELKKAQDENK